MEAKNPHVRHKLRDNMHSLVVKFSEVPNGGLEYGFTHTKGELNSCLFDIMGDFPVYEVNLRVEPIDNMVQIRGNVGGELRLVCSRCAEDFSQNFKKNFLTAFYKSDSNLKNFGVHADDVSDLDGSFDLEILEGEDINLGEVIHEQVALEIPFKPLCKEECKGLCVDCGANWNLQKCDCATKEVKHELVNKISPFEKLRSLTEEK